MTQISNTSALTSRPGNGPDAALASRAAIDSGRSALGGEGATHATELKALIDELVSLVRVSQGDLKADLEHRVAQARERLGTTLAQSRELSARAREQMQRSVEASRDVVVHRPLSAIAMSVAVGLVAGLLLSRRS
jgi:ElaB/YqjD/DUF883 family membrane-anchored ribosome-binding protein